jgi:hypothetical protein
MSIRNSKVLGFSQVMKRIMIEKRLRLFYKSFRVLVEGQLTSLGTEVVGLTLILA